MAVNRLEQRWKISRHYFENHGNVVECAKYVRHNWAIFLRKFANVTEIFSKNFSSQILNTRILLQQNGATCHTVEAKLDVLCPVFEDRIIRRSVDVVWPPQSCDLCYAD